MAEYSTLNVLPPSAFLNPDNFKTDMDNLPTEKYRAAQYQKGVDIGKRSREVGVGCNGCWWATGLDGSHTTSYEGVGYHSATWQLWKGFLDSGCPIRIFRYTGPVDGTVIK